MDKRVDTEILHKMLDDTEKQLEDVGRKMRRLLTDIDRKILPNEEVLQMLGDSLRKTAGMSAALTAASQAFAEDLSADCTITDRRRALSSYEEKCAHAKGREALAVLRRMYADDEECQAAIEHLRASCPSLDAEILGQEKPGLLLEIKLLVEAFREEKPMNPPRKAAGYMMKLKDFPEI